MFSRFIDVENFTIISEVCVIKKSYNHICAEIITYILQLPAYNILNIFRFFIFCICISTVQCYNISRTTKISISKRGEHIKTKIIILSLTITFLLTACQSSSENTTSVSTTAESIIQTIGTCPNEDYYSTADITAIGEGTDDSSEATESEPVDTYQNLKDTLGEYFTDTAFDAFYNQGIADKYFADAFMNNYDITVQKMELVEKGDNSETVKVTFKKGFTEDDNTFAFTE